VPTAVSAIIPTRGDAPFLRAAIASALSQPEVAELLVVHDRRAGEPALPPEVGSDPRVRVVESPRAGPAAARNAGLSQARFPVVALLDDDDAWLEGHLAVALDALSLHPGAAVVATDAGVFDDAAGGAPRSPTSRGSRRGAAPAPGARAATGACCGPTRS